MTSYVCDQLLVRQAVGAAGYRARDSPSVAMGVSLHQIKLRGGVAEDPLRRDLCLLCR